ncbi:MAG: hypothetical protein PHH01_04130 [Patescibacteria group bacterium]|nr:hypothetical protein [Patescibacteria group bacterium]
MKLFKGENEAREYLEQRVPPKDEDREVDLSQLHEQYFDVPEKLSPGHFEFEGRNGFKVSFDLIEAKHAFDRSYIVYRHLLEESGSGAVTGEMRPIYVIDNLSIQTDHFSYGRNDQSRLTSITWLPNLHSVGSELSHKLTYVDKGEMYLIGDDGFFSRPVDLLGFFHELGHIETRSQNDLTREYGSVKKIITSNGLETEPMKVAALELQRERDANAWMLSRTRKLFEDLEIPPEQIRDYVHHSQLKSYHEINRGRLSESSED